MTMLLLVAVAAVLSVLPFSTMAGHRDGSTIDQYSAVNTNDLSMFRDPPCRTAPCASRNLVMIMSVQPLAEPKFGPSYHFQSNALYSFNFSTTPDAIT
jgi:hypothetical protein